MSDFLSDKEFRVPAGDRIEIRGKAFARRVSGGSVDAKSITFTPSQRTQKVALDIVAEEAGEVMFVGSSGATWRKQVEQGANTFFLILEPQPGIAYCENDDGNPPHPVSKGDKVCSYCGGNVIGGIE